MDILKEKLLNAKHAIAFTGAGISVESGIPPFRGRNGIWNKYDPESLDISFFFNNPQQSWQVIREVFYGFFGNAKPNMAHLMLAKLEKAGIIKAIVTQNIDNLHQEAGSKAVIEYHGNSKQIKCTQCGHSEMATKELLATIPVICKKCGSLMKPDFIFFGEGIPATAHYLSVENARQADLVIIIGAQGEVFPAANIPYEAKRNGAFIIEINPEKTTFTRDITDHHIQLKAGEAFAQLHEIMKDTL
jgi:NAD-dependent deacetylase